MLCPCFSQPRFLTWGKNAKHLIWKQSRARSGPADLKCLDTMSSVISQNWRHQQSLWNCTNFFVSQRRRIRLWLVSLPEIGWYGWDFAKFKYLRRVGDLQKSIWTLARSLCRFVSSHFKTYAHSVPASPVVWWHSPDTPWASLNQVWITASDRSLSRQGKGRTLGSNAD